MRITVAGTGYVGLVTGACLSQVGNTVVGLDIDLEKVEKLRNGIVPIYEPGLSEIVKESVQAGLLAFASDYSQALMRAEIVFIAVGTPMGGDGAADLSQVLSAAKAIGAFSQGNLIVIDKSTVPVGTADLVQATINRELARRGVEYEIEVVSNPEFLKEGVAIEDFKRPDRVVIGARSRKAFDTLRELYHPFVFNHDRFIEMDIRSAEMTKYASNAFLATKISFMNEMANICERVGADVNRVRLGIGSDSRIGYSFLYSGVGYGGSCFPKDIQALRKTAADHGYHSRILAAVEEVNADQKLNLVHQVVRRFGESLSGLKFAVWGLAFKPETDDMREAPSVVIIRELLRRGAEVTAYDPKAVRAAQEHYFPGVNGLHFAHNKYDALNGASSLLLVTEWKEFRSPDFDEIRQRLLSPVLFDGRNQYNPEKLIQFGFEYFGIGYAQKKKATPLS